MMRGTIITTLATLAVSALPISLMIPPAALAAEVVSVGDGDTLRVMDQGQRVTVRLACIDAPEKAQKPWGTMSANRLKALLPKGQTVQLREINRDRYGRTVAEVFVNNQSINLQLVSEGMAAVYRQYLKNCDANQFNQAEQRAKQQGLGIWNPSNPLPVMPWDYRRNR